jgi:hypothetical protein
MRRVRGTEEIGVAPERKEKREESEFFWMGITGAERAARKSTRVRRSAISPSRWTWLLATPSRALRCTGWPCASGYRALTGQMS